MAKFNINKYGPRDIGVLVVSGFVVIGVLPALLFTLPNKASESDSQVVQAKALDKSTEKKKQVAIKKMPSEISQARTVFTKVANAQTVLMKQSASKIVGHEKYAQKISDVSDAKAVVEKYVTSPDAIGVWGTDGNWKITPEMATVNSGTKINVIFDVSNDKGVLMYSKQGTYNVASKKITFDATYNTKAYNDSQEARD